MQDFDRKNREFQNLLGKSMAKLSMIRDALDGKSKLARPSKRQVLRLKKQLQAA